jgi:hypothetical protein
MTKEFAEAKLSDMEAAYRRVLAAKGVAPEKIEAALSHDPEMEKDLKKMEALPLTKDSYGAYMPLVQKDGVIAIALWKSGGNPVGILTALYINLGISLP